jgi:hypothetical protein
MTARERSAQSRTGMLHHKSPYETTCKRAYA